MSKTTYLIFIISLFLFYTSSVFAEVGIPVTIVGSTTPGALVTARIPQLEISQPQLADDEGNFEFTFSNIEPGIYLLTLSAMKYGAANEIFQTVGVPTGVESMMLSEINIPLTPVELPIEKSAADINRDGHVNLTDLSILAYYWGRTNPEKGDLNNDGSVNLQDISIMLALWTD